MATSGLMTLSPGVFNAYMIMLALAGLVMLVVACLPVPQRTGARVVGTLIGVAFLGYAFYLRFVFDGAGTVWVFWYVFIVPFAYVARVVKAYAARDRARRVAEQYGHAQTPPAPYHQASQQPGQPGAAPPVTD